MTPVTSAPPTRSTLPLVVEFAGERIEVPGVLAGVPSGVFTIGRDGDLVIDDPYLHRRFLELSVENGMWWLANVGSRISADVTDDTGRVHARLDPGARVPVVFERVRVLFAAGGTAYDVALYTDGIYTVDPPARVFAGAVEAGGAVRLSPSQRLLLVVLAENVLRQAGRGDIPSSAETAMRLGWTLRAVTRMLDTVCAKLEREGVTGLHGVRGKLATNRRLRLVEHAVESRLVSRDDLALLDTLPR